MKNQTLSEKVVALAQRELARRRKHRFDQWGKPAIAKDLDLQQDMLHAGIVAGLIAADGLLLSPAWSRKVSTAIQNGMSEHIRAGGLSYANTWRGGYSTDTRKFGSQLHLTPDAVETVPDEIRADRINTPDDADRRLAQAESSDVAWIEDSDSADPTQDSDASVGIEAATTALNTGRAQLSERDAVAQAAIQCLSLTDRALLGAIQHAGSVERYIAQGRKHRRDVIMGDLRRIRRELHALERDIRAEGAGVEIPHTDVPGAIARTVKLDPDREYQHRPSTRVHNTAPSTVWETGPYSQRVYGNRLKGYMFEYATGPRGLFVHRIKGRDRINVRMLRDRFLRNRRRGRIEAIIELGLWAKADPRIKQLIGVLGIGDAAHVPFGQSVMDAVSV